MPDPCWFEPVDSEGRFRATVHATGPWSRDAQHGGPPAALLTRALERCAPREDMQLARVTCEILGPVPLGELEVSARLARPGRSVQRLEAVLRAGGRDVMTASAWRVARADVPSTGPDGQTPGPDAVSPGPDAGSPLPDRETPIGSFAPFQGFLHSVEWRAVRGNWGEPGPCAVWSRMRGTVVAGEQPSGLQRLMALADCGNGVSSMLDLSRYLFINPELTVHVHREPEGEWLLLDAETAVSKGGAGLATSVLSDSRGPVGRGAQSLLVAPR